MLRDIFAAIFSDLGDVQLEKIRSAIRQSYTRLGWSASSGNLDSVGHTATATNALTIPEFRAFFDLRPT